MKTFTDSHGMVRGLENLGSPFDSGSMLSQPKIGDDDEDQPISFTQVEKELKEIEDLERRQLNLKHSLII